LKSEHDNQDSGARSGADLPRQQVVLRQLPDQSGQEYHVYVPVTAGRNAPVIVAVHDISRNAGDLVTALVEAADRDGAIVISPHFPKERYPNYQRLGGNRNPADENRYADTALIAIVADVLRMARMPTRPIHLFGFGAGGRFAMRFAMLHPGLVSSATFADPETYTFPDPSRRFPRGIAPGNKRRELAFRPEEFLRVPMTLVLGSAAAGARRIRAVDAEPADKGERWLAAMRSAASAYGLEPRVVRIDCDQPLVSAENLLENPVLRDKVMDSLLREFQTGSFPAVAAGTGLVVATPTRELPLILHRDDILLDEALPPPGQRRWLPAAVGAALLAAVITPVAIWTAYRSDNVVSRDAAVRSYIADVGARIDGVISSVEVDAGDRVVAGQVVATLADGHVRARVSQARSQLEKAKRELEVEQLAIENERRRLSGSVRETSADFSAARASVAAAESRADEARRQLELQQSLAAQGLVPAERARTAATELRTAEAQVREARAAAASADAGKDLAVVASDGIAVRVKRISVLESDIASFEAELALAESNLDATVIRAPDSGAVVRRIVQPGGSVAVGQPVIGLWVGEKIWVEAWLDEDDIARIGVGSPATVTFKSYPDREFTGVVESLGVSTDVELPDDQVLQPRRQRMRADPLVSVRVRLEEPVEDLFPGMSAVVAIRSRE
jgi:multidrug resistance efflux pump